jgi:ribulose-phosphate 3-epimerase
MNPIFPSILSSNFFNLESRLKDFASQKMEFIHLDVMDGHFVDNISFGPGAITAIRSKFDFKFDSHLMVSNPEKMIMKYIESGSDWISFHVEIGHHIMENINTIKKNHRSAGLVLNPDTPVQAVFPYIEHIDYVLLMSVFPGYGGQTFRESTYNRVADLRRKINQSGNHCLIQVDGGINTSNIHRLKIAGADLFVVGTFLYDSQSRTDTIHMLLKKINGA